MTDRKMVNFQKRDFLRFFYSFTLNCVTTGLTNSEDSTKGGQMQSLF